MIITITGKPCSGKGTVSKIFCKEHNFEYICVGDIQRQYAESKGYKDILSYSADTSEIINSDLIVDAKTKEIGETRANDDILFDSRLAWHFIPHSFKVFIDVDWDIAAKRLLEANRADEKVKTINEAKKTLISRWEMENNRYQSLYQIDNLNISNYDLVLSSDNATPEELSKTIYKEYKKFIKKAKS